METTLLLWFSVEAQPPAPHSTARRPPVPCWHQILVAPGPQPKLWTPGAAPEPGPEGQTSSSRLCLAPGTMSEPSRPGFIAQRSLQLTSPDQQVGEWKAFGLRKPQPSFVHCVAQSPECPHWLQGSFPGGLQKAGISPDSSKLWVCPPNLPGSPGGPSRDCCGLQGLGPSVPLSTSALAGAGGPGPLGVLLGSSQAQVCSSQWAPTQGLGPPLSSLPLLPTQQWSRHWSGL